MAGISAQESEYFIPRITSQDMEGGIGNHAKGKTPEDLGDDEMFVYLPYSDFRTWIYENETVFKAFEALPIARLGRIKQLSFLAYVGPSPDTQLLHEFSHTRAEHSLVTAKIGEAMLRINGAPEELVDKASVIFVAHDMATPALGDASKKLDKINLDEEDNWEKVMTQRAWDFLDEHGITREEMNDALHNRGLLGEVLDIADRISYVMKDLSQLAVTPILDTKGQEAHDKGYRKDLAKILEEDPSVGEIYKDVMINFETDEICFKNPERLGRFLEIRALLTKNLYMHPVSLARDLLVTDYIRPYYTTDENVASDFVTPDRLRRMGDDGLIDFLSDKHPELIKSIYAALGKGAALFFNFATWYPEFYPGFNTLEELEQRKKEIEETGKYLIRGQLRSKGFNTATDLKVLAPDGKIVPFKEYDPEVAARIQGLSDDTQKFYLFYEEKGRKIK